MQKHYVIYKIESFPFPSALFKIDFKRFQGKHKRLGGEVQDLKKKVDKGELPKELQIKTHIFLTGFDNETGQIANSIHSDQAQKIKTQSLALMKLREILKVYPDEHWFISEIYTSK